MNTKLLAFALTAIILTAGPAAAAPFCNGGTNVLSFGFHIGPAYSERELADLAKMELQRQGVDASRVEFWNGCLRAFVRQPGGGETMEFYDPDTLRRVW